MLFKRKDLYQKMVKIHQFLGFNNVIHNNKKKIKLSNKKMNHNLCQNKMKFK